MVFRCKLLQGLSNDYKVAKFCQSAPVVTTEAADRGTIFDAGEPAPASEDGVEDSSPDTNN